jgi:hypothetical protein
MVTNHRAAAEIADNDSMIVDPWQLVEGGIGRIVQRGEGESLSGGIAKFRGPDVP